MRTIMALLLLAVLTITLAQPADAIIMCISQRDGDRCHPTDGSEPPADCGYPGFWQRISDWAQDRIEGLAARFGGDPDGVGLED